MSFFAQYPPVSGGTSTNASVGTNGAAVPGSSTQIAGQNAGNLQPLQTDGSGNLKVAISSGLANPLPVQDSAAETSLASIDTKTPSLGQKVMASSQPVAIASDQSNLPSNIAAYGGTSTSLGSKVSASSIPVVIASDQAGLPLPTGAATSANQTNASQKTQIVDGSGNVVASTSNALNVNVSAIVANQSMNIAQYGGSSTTLGSKTSANSMPVVIASDQGTLGVNAAQIAGNATLTGNGTTGTGSQRVTIASDNTAFTVNAQIIGQSGSTNANTSIASTAAEASHVLKNAAGRLFQLTGVNNSASAQYIQVFNSTTVPADTTVPILVAYVPGNGTFSWDFGSIGRYFSTGIAVSNSSTFATKTVGSANCWFNAEVL